jgi:alkylation response protein AidB-like acyl-CoA dehydrogenase
MNFERLLSPTSFLQHMLGDVPNQSVLRDYESWWEAHGKAISTAVDRAGTPWVKMFNQRGDRVDEIMMLPDYRRMLLEGYRAGVIWRAFEESLPASFALGYISAYYDMGLYCPYTVSLATAASVDKYASPAIREQFLPALLHKDNAVWQGATWMTEIGGGSDLGAYVGTVATHIEVDQWRLNGDKYFCSNAGAELAVVAARPENAPLGVRGLALFLVPRYRHDGSLNYTIRRLKDKIATRSVPTGEVELRDSEAYLLGEAQNGIYLILEVLNLSRVANSIGSIALAQRAMSDAYTFARDRVAFGKPLLEQPLMRRQFEDRVEALCRGFALAWEVVQLATQTWREVGPRYSDQFHLFRIITHLAKYWTAEFAVQTAKWAMEVNGGLGTLAEFGVERWLREAMIADIWEGPPHRQILDGMEVMERKGAGKLLFNYLTPFAESDALDDVQARVEAHLALPHEEREAGAGELFKTLATFTAQTLLMKHRQSRTQGIPV